MGSAIFRPADGIDINVLPDPLIDPMPHATIHHYLPQYYLRGFSRDKRTIFQIDKSTSKHYARNLQDIALIRNLHEIDGNLTEGPQALERRLAQIEEEEAALFSRALVGGIDKKNVRSNLIELLAGLRVRVPAMREHIDRSFKLSVRTAATTMTSSGKFSPSLKKYKDVPDTDELNFSEMNWKYLEIMSPMADNETTLKILCKMRATVYQAPPGTSFLTCDQPVALYHPSAGRTSYTAGLSTPGVEISFPLSSQVLLKLDHENGGWSERLATSEEVGEFNRRTVVMAETCIFAESVAAHVTSLVRLHSRKFAGFMRDDLNKGEERIHILRSRPVGPA